MSGFTSWLIAAFFLLAACSTPPPPESKRVTDIPPYEPPTAAVGQAPTIAGKCRVIRYWIDRFHHEFPGLILAPPDLPPEAANMFRADFFTSIFGFPYTADHADRLAGTNENLIAVCQTRGTHVMIEDFTALTNLQPFFAYTFARFDEALAAAAADLMQRVQWMQTALEKLDALPGDSTGLERLELEVAMPAPAIIAPLWPSEKYIFTTAIETRRRIIAAQIRFPGTTPTAQDFTKPPFPTPLPNPILTERLAEKRKEIEALPLTREGRRLSRVWLESFEREFAAALIYVDVQSVRTAGIVRRNKIFMATIDDFKEEMATLPAGEGSESQYAALLTRTFPLPGDRALPAYEQYRALIITRQKPFFRRAFTKTLDALTEIGNAISGAARSTVHGPSNAEAAENKEPGSGLRGGEGTP